MAARFWVLGTGTWDNSLTINWSTTSGGVPGAAAPASGDTVTFDANSGGGTVTVAATINGSNTITSITMGAFTGTLDFSVNNPSISMTSFLGSGTGTRTLNLGSGTFTMTNTAGTTWDTVTPTNLTVNAGTSTILLSATATAGRQIALGGRTYNNVTVTNATPNGFFVDLSNGGNFIAANFTLTNVRALRISQAVTHTITGTFTYNGATNSPGLIYTNNGVGTISVASANVLDWIVVQNITKAGAGSLSITNGYDAGGNTGITITNPTGAVSSPSIRPGIN